MFVGNGSVGSGISAEPDGSNAGCFYSYVTGKRDGYCNGSNTNSNWGLGISANRNNSVYGASSTVVPKSRKCKYFIKY